MRMVIRRASSNPFPIVLALVVGLTTCEPAGPDVPPSAALPLRPSDGLLQDPGLQALVDMQVARDGETLAVMLTDARPEVRARAALALASVQDPAALDELLGALADPDASVRRDVALALGQLGAPEAVAALAGALPGESDGQVRARILEALGKIGAVEASEALLDAVVRGPDEGRRTWALAVNGAVRGVITPRMQLHLLGRLTDPDPETRAGAAYFYGRLDNPGVWSVNADRLREALDGYDAADPAAAYLVKALARLGDPADVQRLEQWATTATDWRIRSEAMAALAPHAASQQVASVLLDALDDPVGHVAAAAATSLASATHPPSVLGEIEDRLEGVTELAVIEPLLGLLARQDAREFVFAWVDGLGPDDDRARQVGLSALGMVAGQDAVERLVTQAEDPSTDMGAAAVVALGNRWEDDRRFPHLVPIYLQVMSTALMQGNAVASFAAAQILTDPLFRPLGGPETLVVAYRSELESGEPRQAAELLRLIAFVEAPGAETLLRDALDHPASVVRRIAASGLERVTGEVVEVDVTTDSEEIRRGDQELGYDPTVIDWSYLAGLGAAPELVFETERGRVVVRMVPEEAPHTVQTMARLADAGRFDGTPFHRVIANFVAQGGDVEGGTGRGGPGFQITSEFNGLPYRRGSIGMASAGKDTEGSQFFLAHTRLPHLDGGYTVFGYVTEGMGAVDAILRGDRIVAASLVRD